MPPLRGFDMVGRLVPALTCRANICRPSGAVMQQSSSAYIEVNLFSQLPWRLLGNLEK